MKLFTKTRVMKSNVVEVCLPRLLECQQGEFRFLGEHLSVVHDRQGFDEQGEPQVVSNQWEIDGMTDFGEAKEQAKEITAQAEKNRAHAEQLLAQAQIEVQKLRDEARVEVENLRARVQEEVSQQAYVEGHAQGLTQGLREGKDQGAKEAGKLKAEAEELFQLAQRAVEEELAKVDETLLKLALKISERIVRANLKQHPEHLLQRIRALTLLPEQREGWRLHVAPRDAEWLTRLPLEDRLRIPLAEDDTLNPGDCFLECPEGIFDARLEAQLDRFEQLLGEELRHDRLEQAGR